MIRLRGVHATIVANTATAFSNCNSFIKLKVCNSYHTCTQRYENSLDSKKISRRFSREIFLHSYLFPSVQLIVRSLRIGVNTYLHIEMYIFFRGLKMLKESDKLAVGFSRKKNIKKYSFSLLKRIFLYNFVMVNR